MVSAWAGTAGVFALGTGVTTGAATALVLATASGATTATGAATLTGAAGTGVLTCSDFAYNGFNKLNFILFFKVYIID